MSLSPISLDANRANSQLSTGPRTEEGKQRSSLNAVTHGLFAASAVLPNEDPAAYQNFCQKFQDDLQPKGMLEEQLAQTIIDTQYRLNRCRALEQTVLSAPGYSIRLQIDALNKFSMYEHRLSRGLQTTLKQLLLLQSARKQAEESQFKDASLLAKHHGTKEKPYDPSQDGFVFSSAELALWMHRRDRQNEAIMGGQSHQSYRRADRSTVPSASRR